MYNSSFNVESILLAHNFSETIPAILGGGDKVFIRRFISEFVAFFRNVMLSAIETSQSKFSIESDNMKLISRINEIFRKIKTMKHGANLAHELLSANANMLSKQGYFSIARALDIHYGVDGGLVGGILYCNNPSYNFLHEFNPKNSEEFIDYLYFISTKNICSPDKFYELINGSWMFGQRNRAALRFGAKISDQNTFFDFLLSPKWIADNNDLTPYLDALFLVWLERENDKHHRGSLVSRCAGAMFYLMQRAGHDDSLITEEKLRAYYEERSHFDEHATTRVAIHFLNEFAGSENGLNKAIYLLSQCAVKFHSAECQQLLGQIGSKKPEVFISLADFYLKNSNTEMAINYYKKAIACQYSAVHEKIASLPLTADQCKDIAQFYERNLLAPRHLLCAIRFYEKAKLLGCIDVDSKLAELEMLDSKEKAADYEQSTKYLFDLHNNSNTDAILQLRRVMPYCNGATRQQFSEIKKTRNML